MNDVASPRWFDLAALTDVGTEREHNEDHCGVLSDGEHCAMAAVADGVSSAEGGEEASRLAIETALRSFGEQGPSVAAGKRLARAVQQANIEIYDRAVVVPELRGMTTTITALAIHEGELTAAHVGDSRLYLVRGEEISQLTKDHTVTGERVRLGLLSEARARHHPDRSTLTRSLGRELIVAVDKITTRVYRHDVLIACSDGLYNVLGDEEMRRLATEVDAAAGCRALVDAANERGTPDNLSAVVVRVLAGAPARPEQDGLGARLRRLLGGGR